MCLHDYLGCDILCWLLEQKTTDGAAYRRTLTSANSGGWTSESRGPALGRPSSWLTGGPHLTASPYKEGESSGLFISSQGHSSIHGAPPSWPSEPNSLPQAPPPKAIPLGVRASTPVGSAACWDHTAPSMEGWVYSSLLGPQV